MAAAAMPPTPICSCTKQELLSDYPGNNVGEDCPLCKRYGQEIPAIGFHPSQPIVTPSSSSNFLSTRCNGWLRDLTCEGIESNPGPCQDGPVSAPCKCSLTKEELVQAGQPAVGGTCPDCQHKVSMHSSGAAAASSQLGYYRRGWLRDLTREGVEANPGPVYCRGKQSDGSSCDCSNKKSDLRAGRLPSAIVDGEACACQHKVYQHDDTEVSFGSGNLAAVSASPRLVSIQVWNIETCRAEEIHNVLLNQRTWDELECAVKDAFKNRWTEENKGRFALYYIHDLLQPLETRADVSNQNQLDGYFAFLDHPPRDRGLMLFLNVAVIFQASGKPVSPVKPPLCIDTALARLHDADRRQSSTSASHLSPDSATSPQSPGTPRQKEFRQMVLARDSDGCVRPDVALMQSPLPAIFCCVFCETRLQPLPKQIEACHVVPHADRERLGKPLDVQQQLAIGGSAEDVANGVSVCSICHGVFDSGLLWVEVQADGTQLIHVDESSRQVAHFHTLHGKSVRMPLNPAFPFPGQVAWRWRKEWAELKRHEAAEKTAEKLAKLSIGGACLGNCGGKSKNKACKNGLCKSCCDKTDTGCSVHPLSGRPVSSPTSGR